MSSGFFRSKSCACPFTNDHPAFTLVITHLEQSQGEENRILNDSTSQPVCHPRRQKHVLPYSSPPARFHATCRVDWSAALHPLHHAVPPGTQFGLAEDHVANLDTERLTHVDPLTSHCNSYPTTWRCQNQVEPGGGGSYAAAPRRRQKSSQISDLNGRIEVTWLWLKIMVKMVHEPHPHRFRWFRIQDSKTCWHCALHRVLIMPPRPVHSGPP